MANRSLGLNEVQRLVAISGRAAASIDARTSWPGRENSRLLAQAVKDKLPFAMLKDSRIDMFPIARNLDNTLVTQRRFRIRYNGDGDSIFISPDDNAFTPCGYFSIHKLMEVLDSIEGLEEYID